MCAVACLLDLLVVCLLGCLRVALAVVSRTMPHCSSTKRESISETNAKIDSTIADIADLRAKVLLIDSGQKEVDTSRVAMESPTDHLAEIFAHFLDTFESKVEHIVIKVVLRDLAPLHLPLHMLHVEETSQV